ncbi:MAG: hypothetical protein WBF93_20775 [Pirellulales bacterium]|nr:hypothetical protein [Pirellulales bacterium]
MDELKQRLPGFLDSITRSKSVALAFYNAGTDVYEGDQLGGLHLTASGVLDRDLYVVAELRKRKIPTVMLLSGGYSSESYQLVANSVNELIARY